MCLFRFGALLALVLTGCATAPPASTPNPGSPLQPALNALLQGDAREASRLFESSNAPLTEKDTEAAQCIYSRFAETAPVADLPRATRAILAAYQEYWRFAMLKIHPTPMLEANLLDRLIAIPAMRGAAKHGDLDVMSDYAVRVIEAEGLHALAGRTEPFYELMIWKREETKVYDVTLPEGPIRVKVVFLDDFASMGWAGFATCGIAQTGGWAKPDALYAVRSGYDLESEAFRVSYLAHEGQHFADYRKFPQLEQPELEYRAKLTEIAVSSATTAELVGQFTALGGDSRSVPHAFANRRVALVLKDVPLNRVREVARQKLLESTATLQRLGAATTKRFLGD